MSDSVWIAVIVAIGPIISNIITHYLSSKKLNHITELTNSTLTAAKNEIAELKQTIISQHITMMNVENGKQ